MNILLSTKYFKHKTGYLSFVHIRTLWEIWVKKKEICVDEKLSFYHYIFFFLVKKNINSLKFFWERLQKISL